MKTPSNFLIPAALAAVVLASSILHPVEVPLPVRTTPMPQPIEQYRVIDANRVPVSSAQAAPATLEGLLNELGAQGWRVRTAMGSTIILAR